VQATVNVPASRSRTNPEPFAKAADQRDMLALCGVPLLRPTTKVPAGPVARL
jgi:hypothetical protein